MKKRMIALFVTVLLFAFSAVPAFAGNNTDFSVAVISDKTYYRAGETVTAAIKLNGAGQTLGACQLALDYSDAGVFELTDFTADEQLPAEYRLNDNKLIFSFAGNNAIQIGTDGVALGTATFQIASTASEGRYSIGLTDVIVVSDRSGSAISTENLETAEEDLLLADTQITSADIQVIDDCYTYTVSTYDSSNTNPVSSVEVGDVVTVRLSISGKTDANNQIIVYAKQDYIKADKNCFTLVSDSCSASSGFTATANTNPTGIKVALTRSAASGTTMENGTTVLSFRLRALKAGTPEIAQSGAQMNQNSMTSLPVNAESTTITVEDREKPVEMTYDNTAKQITITNYAADKVTGDLWMAAYDSNGKQLSIARVKEGVAVSGCCGEVTYTPSSNAPLTKLFFVKSDFSPLCEALSLTGGTK